MTTIKNTATACLTAFALLALGACDPGYPGDTDEVALTTGTDSDTSGPGCVGLACGTTTSTVTGVTTASGGSTTDDTAGDTDGKTTGEDSSSTGDSEGDTSTTEAPLTCNEDLICDEGENLQGCLHDCGICDDDEVCDDDETPYSCPGDCPAINCVEDDHINAEFEQCDGESDCDANCNLRRYAFVTSKSYQGDLGGLTGADQKCNTLAQEVGLPGVYMAWLSSIDGSPKTRFNSKEYRGTYALVTGDIIAIGWEGLISGNLLNPLNVNELGEVEDILVWTNTLPNGNMITPYSDCDDWTSTDKQSGATGYSKRTDEWSQWGGPNDYLGCDNPSRLYCFQVQ